MRYQTLQRAIQAAARSRRARVACACAAVAVCLALAWGLRGAAAPLRVSAQGVRCHARLPAAAGGGWNTVLAECDGRALAIAPPQKISLGDNRPRTVSNSVEYARDMEAIRGVLNSQPTPTPAWVPVTAILLCLALIGGGVYGLRALLRRLSQLKAVLRARAVQALAAKGGEGLTPQH